MKRSTKLAIVGCVLTVGGLIALTPKAVENYYRRQLRATLTRYAAAGDPIDLKLYQTAPIPDDQNRGAQLLRLAKPFTNIPSEINEIHNGLWEMEPPISSVSLTSEQKKSIADFLRDNLPPDAELDAALAIQKTKWQHTDSAGEVTHLRPLRVFATALAYDARFAAQDSDNRRFARRVLQIMGIADAAGSDSALLGSNAQNRIDSLAALLVLDYPLTLSDDETRQLIKVFLDDPPRTARSQAAIEYARAAIIEDILNYVPDGKSTNLPMRIYITRNAPQSIEAITLLRDALIANSSAESEALSQRAQSFGWMINFHPGIAYHTVKAVRRSRTERRLAAIALATRAFATKHGHLPIALSDLVPEYLPVVPLDPFDPEDGPFLTTPNFRIVYSRSDNRIDDGGDFSTANHKYSYPPGLWDAPDRGISFAPSTSTRPSR